MKTESIRKYLYPIFASAAALLVMLLVILDPLYPADTSVTDRLYSELNGTDSRIMIVGIDEETLSLYGNFTLWSREKVAELLNRLYEDAGNAPAVVGLDFIFTDHFDETADAALASAVKGRNVVIGTNVVYRGAVEIDGSGKRFYNTEHIADVEMPFEELEDASAGFTNVTISPDGFVRVAVSSIKLPRELWDKAGETHDSFAMAVYKNYMAFIGGEAGIPAGDGKGRFLFKYSGCSGEYSMVSLSAVLSGRVPAEAFKDAIVLVGAYAPGFQDSYQPASDRDKVMYGVEAHANIVQAYLQGKTMLPANSLLQGAAAALIVLAFLMLLREKKLPLIIILSFVTAGAYALAGRILSENGVYISCIYIFLALVLADIYFILEKYLLEGIRRRHTLDVFKKYVAPQVVDELSHSGDFELHLGGEKRDVAVLFIDIRGFTSLSEILSPEQVVEILNEYLKLVTDCVLAHNGTLDKFIGDAAMAIFNAPFDLDDYIYEAVATARDIRGKAEELEKKLYDRFEKSIRFGIGVNCGPAIVGNIGCDFRMDYTAIGDTVNTAARLESNAKAGQILISSDVRTALGERLEAESVGEIPLKGKSRKIEVFSVTELKEKKKGISDES